MLVCYPFNVNDLLRTMTMLVRTLALRIDYGDGCMMRSSSTKTVIS